MDVDFTIELCATVLPDRLKVSIIGVLTLGNFDYYNDEIEAVKVRCLTQMVQLVELDFGHAKVHRECFPGIVDSLIELMPLVPVECNMVGMQPIPEKIPKHDAC